MPGLEGCFDNQGGMRKD